MAGPLSRFYGSVFCLFAIVIGVSPIASPLAGASGVRVLPTPTPQAAVIAVTVISAARAAATLRALFPHATIRVDRSANAVIAVGTPDELQVMRAVLQGIDIKNPALPTADVVQVRFLETKETIPRLRRLFPNAHIEVANRSTLLIRAVPSDMAQIKALVSSLDQAPPSPAPATPSPTDSVRITQANPKIVARAIARQLPHMRASVSGGTILLAGPQDEIAKAKEIAQSIDQPAFGSRYTEIYRLHNIDAASVGDLVMRSYPNVRVTVDKDLNALSVFATAAQHQRISSALSQLDAGTGGTPGQPGGGSPAYGSSNFDVVQLDSAMPGQNGSPSTTASDIAQSVRDLLGTMAPDLRISVPPNSSEILLAGSPTSIKLARDIIARLDQPQPLVVLDTEVLEIDETKARTIGLEFPNLLQSQFSEITPVNDTNNPGPPRLIGFQPLTRSALQFNVILHALVQNGDARVLADPRITTISGHTATIRAGDQISILTTSGGGVGTPVTQQIQNFNTGVTLDITPMIGPSGNITVGLHPVVNSLASGSSAGGLPEIATRDAQTVVQLHDNETIAIGGLIQETTTRTVTKVPYLGEIPVVGKLFQSSDLEHRRNELVIVVTPHIVKPGGSALAPTFIRPLPAPEPLPTLAPGTVLPGSSAQPIPRAHPYPAPTSVPTDGVQLFTPIPTASPMPLRTPSAFASANVFEYGAAPQNTFANATDSPQIFYLNFAPTVLRSGTPVQISVITTSNVKKVTVGYSGFSTALSQVGPSKWQAVYNFNVSGLSSGLNSATLTVNAFNEQGVSATVQIPVSISK